MNILWRKTNGNRSKKIFCHIRVDTTFNAGNLPMQNIKSLNEKITNAVEEWSKEMANKGLRVDVGWDWSEATKLDEELKLKFMEIKR